MQFTHNHSIGYCGRKKHPYSRFLKQGSSRSKRTDNRRDLVMGPRT